MRCGSIRIYGLMVLALGVAPGVALAQESQNASQNASQNPLQNPLQNPWLAITPNTDEAAAAPPSEPQEGAQGGGVQEGGVQESASTELTPEEQEALRNILNNTPSVAVDGPAKRLRAPTFKQFKKFDMSRTDKPDGSSNLTLNQPLPIDWDAKVDYLPTGTSFGAKVATNSTDPVTHNQFVAEQKVYGPLNVTTAVTDIGQTSASKSITARFKLNW